MMPAFIMFCIKDGFTKFHQIAPTQPAALSPLSSEGAAAS